MGPNSTARFAGQVAHRATGLLPRRGRGAHSLAQFPSLTRLCVDSARSAEKECCFQIRTRMPYRWAGSWPVGWEVRMERVYTPGPDDALLSGDSSNTPGRSITVSENDRPTGFQGSGLLVYHAALQG